MTKTLRDVYAQYKHLEQVALNPLWEDAISCMLRDCWQAIKAHLSPEQKFGPTQDVILRDEEAR